MIARDDQTRRAGVARLLALSAIAAGMWIPVHGYYIVHFHVIGVLPLEAWPEMLMGILVRVLRWTALTPFAIVAAQRLTWERGRRARTVAGLVLLVAGLATMAPPNIPALPRSYDHLVVKLRSAMTPYSVTVSVLAVMFGYILAGSHESAEHKRRRRELDESLGRIHEEQLRARIGPQFLFSALEAIRRTIRSAPARAEAAVVDLAELLRVVLKLNRQPVITVEQELDVVDRFVTSSGTTRLGVRASEEALRTAMPPLIAFAVVATFMPQSPASVDVDVEAGAEQLRFGIGITRRGAAGEPVPSELLRLEERLRRLYGGNARLTIRPESRRVHVLVDLPLSPNVPSIPGAPS